MKHKVAKLTNIGIPAVTLSDISQGNMKREREGLSLLFMEDQKLG